jgi:hypothetical protein
MVGPREELVKEGDFHNPETLDGVIERVAKPTVDPTIVLC